ncbi:bifunctional folylpolyglutamate synthase/dihydrofolate synthase [Auraticoccus monumenti]|uniref:Dihydrofolate synthase/folylpolyglutamate synthase n=1 Tax=Auraticoccus monumenti TaxID=675864 RepID=A0A1G7ERK8_9ACTN|nr:folylpolyglutamate synthase/dihydrofolate synthase family protein [Auraticoccus monumenti]SDE66045.1 dihydrofolate synthase / folylpolyglutamate synthase [Auraticoccus monumenti]
MADTETHAQITARLQSRWPEQRVAPSLGRINALLALLGDPHRAAPAIHITGTNGKGSTAIVADALLRAAGLRTGRFSSPHLSRVNERISIDGEPIDDERFDALWHELEPFVAMVDEQRIDGVEMTFFEVITAMAFAAFADAPVDVVVLEVGLGGTWDATNAADGDVAVITPIDLDHTHLLGSTVAEVAREKAGIIKPGATAVLAGQPLEAATVLLERAMEAGALVQREGVDFGLLERTPAVGGQVLRINAAEGPVGDLHLPAHGAHLAQNAALAVAAVEAFLGMKALSPDIIQEGFDAVRLPGRMEVVRRGPTILLDAAHNPHGARATAAAVREAFDFSPLVGVLAVMGDKDVVGIVEAWSELFDSVVVTQVASTDRGMPAEQLGEVASGVLGGDRVHVVPRMDDAIERAVALAEADGAPVPGVVVTGSVIAVGEARTLLVSAEEERRAVEEPVLEVGEAMPPEDYDGSEPKGFGW